MVKDSTAPSQHLDISTTRITSSMSDSAQPTNPQQNATLVQNKAGQGEDLIGTSDTAATENNVSNQAAGNDISTTNHEGRPSFDSRGEPHHELANAEATLEPKKMEQVQGEQDQTHHVEQEASEHLARRAAEMTVEDGSTVSNKGKKDVMPATNQMTFPESNKGKAKSTAQDDEYDEKHPPEVENRPEIPEAPQGTTEPTGEEIQDIMNQFRDGIGGPGEQEIMSPRLEKQQPILHLPPRTSSLEPKESYTMSPQTKGQSSEYPFPARSAKAQSVSGNSLHQSKSGDGESIHSAHAGSVFQPPPPSPDPEPTLPFDFHRFLEQLRHRTADPVARYLRSFLTEFGKKQWQAHEQVKVIGDFLEFISKKMMQCEVWRMVSDAEFDNAREGMEKLVMNRLYAQTFSPAIPPPDGSPRKRGKGNKILGDVANPAGPGRRGQHQEDVEKDEVIAERLRIYGWINEEHLDIAPLGEKGRKFLVLAQQELLKINTYRAPRDKVICVLNCCKVIFGFLKNSKSDQSADAFVPLFIYTVLQARPEHLVSNVQYIWRFRNQDKLGGEAGYYMSSLMGVVSFIENLDRTNLTITNEEFENNVEQAVRTIAEGHKAEEYEQHLHATGGATAAFNPALPSAPMQHLAEKSALSRAEVTPRNSMDAERSSPRRNVSQRLSNRTSSSQQNSATEEDDNSDAVTGLLRTIQKPLSSIGRIFSDDAGTQPQQQQTDSRRPSGARLATAPLPQRRAPSPSKPDRGHRPSAGQRAQTQTTDDVAARQAQEIAHAQRMRAQEQSVVVETLQGMFPSLDKEVLEDVVRSQDGNVGRAVDACLAMSG
ncbi:hypothetical protein MBLNU230_g1076t1 [Neophaeotheca triangularis]